MECSMCEMKYLCLVNHYKSHMSESQNMYLRFVIINLFSVCGLNCHHKCEKKVSNLCGVNQKLLAEALESIRPNRQKPSTPASKSKTADGKNRSKC